MRWFRADLHIHTVLSACADLSMGPRDIVKTALNKGIDIIAITDHNSAANVMAVMEAARGTPLTVIPGIEVNTREEIHMIALFPETNQLFAFQDFVYAHLQEGTHDSEWLGAQVICDADENIIGEETRLLSLPTTIPYLDMATKVVEHDGIVYPAHVDRRTNGILRILGFLPRNLPYPIVEVSKNIEPELSIERYSHNNTLKVIRASDAHLLEDIGSALTFFWLEKPTFQEIYWALTQQNNRKTEIVLPTTIEKATVLPKNG